MSEAASCVCHDAQPASGTPFRFAGIRGQTLVSTVETEAAHIYSGSGNFSPLFSEGQFVFIEFRKAAESQS
jgi:hypothetical protein